MWKAEINSEQQIKLWLHRYVADIHKAHKSMRYKHSDDYRNTVRSIPDHKHTTDSDKLRCKFPYV